ncbi:SPOSA6832_05020, partial [Sporobolomyces salmonicolor]
APSVVSRSGDPLARFDLLFAHPDLSQCGLLLLARQAKAWLLPAPRRALVRRCRRGEPDKQRRCKEEQGWKAQGARETQQERRCVGWCCSGLAVQNHSNTEGLSPTTSPYNDKENDPLAQYDHSAVPEPEDSFYTSSSSHWTSFSCSPSALWTPNTSYIYPSPRPERPSPVHLSPSRPRYGGKNPTTFSSLSTLSSREPYLDPVRFPHSCAIPEEDELDARRKAGRKSWADEMDEAEGNSLPVAEQAEFEVYGKGGREEYGPLETLLKRATLSETSLPKGGETNDGCAGCGAERTLSFVTLFPCQHVCCHVCLNSLINGAAHKPPRPSDCFTCAHHIGSFEPLYNEISTTNGGIGLVQALAISLQNGESMRIAKASVYHDEVNDDECPVEEDRRITRSRRRRSSVVAAAIAATLLASPPGGKSNRRASSPVEKFGHPPRRSVMSATTDSHNNLSLLPASEAGPASGRLFDRLDGGADQSFSTDLVTPSQRSVSSRAGSCAESGYQSSECLSDTSSKRFRSPVAVEQLNSIVSSSPQPVDWPVVRLDNIPWEVTVDEIERWLPDGSLASDLEPSMGRIEGGEGKGEKVGGVTLAVHILCNRFALHYYFSLTAARSTRPTSSAARSWPHGSSQAELLTTLFPTYTPGFGGLEANANIRKSFAPCPLLLQTELTGLLNLCRLESPHACKVPERPYLNLVSILQKVRSSECIPTQALPATLADEISRAPNSFLGISVRSITRSRSFDCSTPAPLRLRSSEPSRTASPTGATSSPCWSDLSLPPSTSTLLTSLSLQVDAVLRCPAFRPVQKNKIVRLAASLGFKQSFPRMMIPTTSVPAHSGSGVNLVDAFSFSPPSMRESYVSTVPEPRYLLHHQDETAEAAPIVELGMISTRLLEDEVADDERESERRKTLSKVRSTPHLVGTLSFSSALRLPPLPPVPPTHARYHRRMSSIARELEIDVSLVSAVVKVLGINLAVGPDDDEGAAE